MPPRPSQSHNHKPRNHTLDGPSNHGRHNNAPTFNGPSPSRRPHSNPGNPKLPASTLVPSQGPSNHVRCPDSLELLFRKYNKPREHTELVLELDKLKGKILSDGDIEYLRGFSKVTKLHMEIGSALFYIALDFISALFPSEELGLSYSGGVEVDDQWVTGLPRFNLTVKSLKINLGPRTDNVVEQFLKAVYIPTESLSVTMFTSPPVTALIAACAVTVTSLELTWPSDSAWDGNNISDATSLKTVKLSFCYGAAVPATRTILTVPSDVKLMIIHIRDINHFGLPNSVRERESEQLTNLEDALFKFLDRGDGRLRLLYNYLGKGKSEADILREVLKATTSSDRRSRVELQCVAKE